MLVLQLTVLDELLFLPIFRFSLFHLEYQPQTTNGLVKLLTKHYRNQALFELHTLIFGLDVLGNPVSVVRGVVFGAKDLFYEPFKVCGSILPDLVCPLCSLASLPRCCLRFDCEFSPQGSVLGPEEFFEGLGIGLKSFFGAGVVGMVSVLLFSFALAIFLGSYMK